MLTSAVLETSVATGCHPSGLLPPKATDSGDVNGLLAPPPSQTRQARGHSGERDIFFWASSVAIDCEGKHTHVQPVNFCQHMYIEYYIMILIIIYNYIYM